MTEPSIQKRSAVNASARQETAKTLVSLVATAPAPTTHASASLSASAAAAASTSTPTPRFANAIPLTVQNIPSSGGPRGEPTLWYPLELTGTIPTLLLPPNIFKNCTLCNQYPSLTPDNVPVPKLDAKSKQVSAEYLALVDKWAPTLPKLTEGELSELVNKLVQWCTDVIDVWYPKPYLFSVRSCRIINMFDLDKVLGWYTGSQDAQYIESFIREFEHAVQHPKSSFCTHFVTTVHIGDTPVRAINPIALVMVLPMIITQLGCVEAACRASIMSSMIPYFLGYTLPITANVTQRLSWFCVRYITPNVYASYEELRKQYQTLLAHSNEQAALLRQIDQVEQERRKIKASNQNSVAAATTSTSTPTREQLDLVAIASSILHHNVEAYEVLTSRADTLPDTDTDSKSVVEVAARNVVYYVKLIEQMSSGTPVVERPNKRKASRAASSGTRTDSNSSAAAAATITTTTSGETPTWTSPRSAASSKPTRASKRSRRSKSPLY